MWVRQLISLCFWQPKMPLQYPRNFCSDQCILKFPGDSYPYHDTYLDTCYERKMPLLKSCWICVAQKLWTATTSVITNGIVPHMVTMSCLFAMTLLFDKFNLRFCLTFIAQRSEQKFRSAGLTTLHHFDKTEKQASLNFSQVQQCSTVQALKVPKRMSIVPRVYLKG